MMNTLSEYVGCKVKMIRKSLHISQAELAEKSGLTVFTISRIERGVQAPTDETMKKICDAFHMSVADVISYTLADNIREDDFEQDLAMVSENGFYWNTVFDDKLKHSRPLTDLEYDIVKYCFGKEYINNACAELAYADFEKEMFSSDDLLNAAKSIYGYITENKVYKSKVVKEFLELLPKYIKKHGG